MLLTKGGGLLLNLLNLLGNFTQLTISDLEIHEAFALSLVLALAVHCALADDLSYWRQGVP